MLLAPGLPWKFCLGLFNCHGSFTRKQPRDAPIDKRSRGVYEQAHRASLLMAQMDSLGW